jgi:hypothetical protein
MYGKISLNLFSETFILLRINERDISMNLYWYVCEVPVTLYIF